MNDDWLTPVTAADHFSQQRRRADVDHRRPVIRKAHELVGPGIAASAIPTTDLNDTLVTYNGYFSCEPGAANAPNATASFIGIVVADSELGGRQQFTSLDTDETYERTFQRHPLDPTVLFWGAWRLAGAVPSGSVIMSAAPLPEPGWLVCDGSEVSRTTYARLFAVIGEAYGPGDGSTTFNLPNLTAKFPRGGTPGTSGGNDSVTLGVANLPSHTHAIDHNHESFSTGASGAHVHNGKTVAADDGAASGADIVRFRDATLSGTVTQVTNDGGGSHAHDIDVPGFEGASGATGSAAPVNTVPAWVGLLFVIKT